MLITLLLIPLPCLADDSYYPSAISGNPYEQQRIILEDQNKLLAEQNKILKDEEWRRQIRDSEQLGRDLDAERATKKSEGREWLYMNPYDTDN